MTDTTSPEDRIAFTFHRKSRAPPVGKLKLEDAIDRVGGAKFLGEWGRGKAFRHIPCSKTKGGGYSIMAHEADGNGTYKLVPKRRIAVDDEPSLLKALEMYDQTCSDLCAALEEGVVGAFCYNNAITRIGRNKRGVWRDSSLWKVGKLRRGTMGPPVAILLSAIDFEAWFLRRWPPKIIQIHALAKAINDYLTQLRTGLPDRQIGRQTLETIAKPFAQGKADINRLWGEIEPSYRHEPPLLDGRPRGGQQKKLARLTESEKWRLVEICREAIRR